MSTFYQNVGRNNSRSMRMNAQFEREMTPQAIDQRSAEKEYYSGLIARLHTLEPDRVVRFDILMNLPGKSIAENIPALEAIINERCATAAAEMDKEMDSLRFTADDELTDFSPEMDTDLYA